MEIIFIRHGQGEHNLNVPERLNIIHPHLTSKGKDQVGRLRSIFGFMDNDLFVVSPTIRTIETVNILSSDISIPRKYISPMAGPRMFPQNPEWNTLPCDEPLPKERIEQEYPEFLIRNEEDDRIWIEGINKMEEGVFNELAASFLDWIRAQCNRAFIVTHDGTINSYRKLMGEEGLTRADFLGEAGYFKISL